MRCKTSFLLLLGLPLLLCLHTGCDPEIFEGIRVLSFQHTIVPANSNADTVRVRALDFPNTLESNANTFIAVLPPPTSPAFNRVQITGDRGTAFSSLLIRRNNEAPVNGVSGLLIEAIGPIEVGRRIENVVIEVFTGQSQDAPIFSSGQSAAGRPRFGSLLVTELDTVSNIVAGEFAAYCQDIVDTQNSEAMIVFDGSFRLSYE